GPPGRHRPGLRQAHLPKARRRLQDRGAPGRRAPGPPPTVSEAARRVRQAEMQGAIRSLSSVITLLLAAGLAALAPLVPGVEAALGVGPADTLLAMAVFAGAMLLAAAAWHLTGPSRLYWLLEAFESWCVVASLLYLIHA